MLFPNLLLDFCSAKQIHKNHKNYQTICQNSNITQIVNFADFLLVFRSTSETHSYFNKSNCHNCNMMEKMIKFKFTISQKIISVFYTLNCYATLALKSED